MPQPEIDDVPDISALRPVLSAARADMNQLTKLLCVIVHPSHRTFFRVWYAYFRFVDDVADSAALSVADRATAVTAHHHLMQTLYDGPPIPRADSEDRPTLLLHALVALDRIRGAQLKDAFLEMLSCLAFDVSRHGRASSETELTSYFTREVVSYLTALQFFCTNRVDDVGPLSRLGIAGKTSHLLRDLISDLADGTVNISVEDVNHYSLDLAGITRSRQDGLTPWVEAKVNAAKAAVREGLPSLHHHRSIRYKLAIALLVVKYRRYLQMIERDGHQLREQYNFTIRDATSVVGTSLALSGHLLWQHLRRV